MRKRISLVGSTICLVVILGFNSLAAAGDLNPPPGPIGPTMKTLTEVEPRVAVQSLPGSATALHVISQPGSYYLTGNITGVSGRNGIEITTDNVTLDLNGFAVIGVSGSLDGVLVPPGDGPTAVLRNIAVHNGVVRGWGGDGIDAQFSGNHVFENLRAHDNAQWGLKIGSNASVNSCIANGNSSGGILIGTVATAWSCHASENGGPGIQIAVRAETGTLSHCTSKENAGPGFLTGLHVLVRDCVATNNTGAGIVVQSECFVINNTCRRNFQGIHVTGSSNRIEANHVINNNNRGLKVDSGSNLIIKNSAHGNGGNYEIAVGNDVGPLGSAATATSPWANIDF